MLVIFAPFFLLFTAASAMASCANYCVAIRGNGELAPAHWSALARMAEQNGLPQALAGGSSATATMFLVDSVAGNPAVKTASSDGQKKQFAALLLKSLPEFVTIMSKDAGVMDVYALSQFFGSMKKESTLTMAKDLLATLKMLESAESPSAGMIENSLSQYKSLINPELLQLVEKNPKAFLPEAEESIAKLGAFDAVNDKTLFFRPGLIDFKAFAVQLGHIGDFYAGNTDSATQARLNAILEKCAANAVGKEWLDSSNSDCSNQFDALVSDYLSAGKFQDKMLYEMAGTNVDALSSIGVIRGASGLKAYAAEKQKYEGGDFSTAFAYHLNFNTDFGFGYWGKKADLTASSVGERVERQTGDVKSKNFQALGRVNWFTVLATSPGEPGLANPQLIPANATAELVNGELAKPATKRWKMPPFQYDGNYLATGGWSDLDPSAVLKAGACANLPVVYLTRKGGDSVFAQQVFLRLTGTQSQVPGWDKLAAVNNVGLCSLNDASGNLWNEMYNICNPDSSFNRSLNTADAVYCTDWDNPDYETFDGKMPELVKNAYESPLIPLTKAGADCSLNPLATKPTSASLPGCIPGAAKDAATLGAAATENGDAPK